MVEYVKLSCPGCGRELRVRKQYAGFEVKCSHCEQPFLVPMSDSRSGAVTLAVASPPADREAERAAERAKARCAELERELERAEAETERLASELARAVQERDRVAADLRTRAEDREHLAANLQRAIEEKDRLAADLTTISAERDRAVQTSSHAEAGAAALQAEVASVRAELATLQPRVAAHDSEIAPLQAEIATLKSELATLQQQIPDANEQGQITGVLRGELTDTQNELEQLRSQTRALEAQAASAATLESELNRAQQQLGELQANCERASHERVTITADRDRLAAELDRCAAEHDQRAARLREAEQTIVESQRAAELASERDSAVAKWRQELADLQEKSTRELHAARAELDRQRLLADEAAQKRAAAESVAACEASSLREELKRLGTRCRQLEQAVKDANWQRDEATAEADRQRLAAEQFRDAAQQAAAIQSRLDELAEQVKEHEAVRDALERDHAAEVARLAASLKAAEQQRDALARRIPEQSETTQQQVQDLSRQLQSAQSELEYLRSVISSLGIKVA
jgi:chromosome segregation ATPase